MPGPWVDADACLSDAKARLHMAQANASPEQMGILLPGGVIRGYQHIIGRLGKRGYLPAQLDSWSGRVQFNTDYAIAFTFRHMAFAADIDQTAIDKELEYLDKFLDELQLLTDDTGAVISPNPLYSGGASSGRICSYDQDLREVKEW